MSLMAVNGSNDTTNATLVMMTRGLDIPTGERVANLVVLVPLLLLGLVGNTIVACVIITGKNNNQRTKSNAYVLSLAIVDLIFLLSGPGSNLLRYAHGTTEWFLPAVLCKIFNFTSYASANSGAFIIACFSIERFFAVYFPLKLFRTITLAKQLLIVACAIAVPTGYSVVWLVNVEVNSNGVCSYKSTDRREYLVFYLIDLCVFFALPLAIMIVANSFIIYRIVSVGFDEDVAISASSSRLTSQDSNCRSLTVIANGNNIKMAAGRRSSCAAVLNGGSNNNGGVSYNNNVVGSSPNFMAVPPTQTQRLVLTRNKSNNNSFVRRGSVMTRRGSTLSGARHSIVGGSSGDSTLATKMLVAVSIIFIVTCMPYRLFVVYNSFFKQLGSTQFRIWTSNVCRWLWYFNSAVNPIIYNVLSNRFRRSVIQLVMMSTRLLPSGLKRTFSNRTVLSGAQLGDESSMTIQQSHINLLYMKTMTTATAATAVSSQSTTDQTSSFFPLDDSYVNNSTSHDQTSLLFSQDHPHHPHHPHQPSAIISNKNGGHFIIANNDDDEADDEEGD